MRKNSFQQLLIHATKIYSHGKSSPDASNFARSRGCADTAFRCLLVGQSKGERVWERIRSMEEFLIQMYDRERLYKSDYDNLEII